MVTVHETIVLVDTDWQIDLFHLIHVDFVQFSQSMCFVNIVLLHNNHIPTQVCINIITPIMSTTV